MIDFNSFASSKVGTIVDLDLNLNSLTDKRVSKFRIYVACARSGAEEVANAPARVALTVSEQIMPRQNATKL